MKHNKKFYLVIVVNSLIIILGICLLVIGLKEENNIIQYSYEIQRKSSYEILLKENNYYDTNILPSGYVYASKSINKAKIDFKYFLKGKEKTNIKYNYSITGNLIGRVDYENEENKEIWNKSFVFSKDFYEEEADTNNLLIDKDVSIEYDYYSDLVNSYEKEYGISIDAVLKLFLNVSYEIDLSKFNIENEIIRDVIEVDIPINNTVTEVKEKYKKNDFKEIKADENNYKIDKIICLIFGITLLSIEAILLYKKIEEIIKKNLKENYIKNILKNYNNLIVTVENEPDTSNLKIMKIIQFEDLVDIAEQNQTNIIHFEIIKNKESKFYVIVGRYV